MEIQYDNHVFQFTLHTHQELITRHITAHGVWEEDFSKIWYDHIRAGDLVLDIGANLGWYTKLANLKGATSIAIEPETENFRLLQHNCSGDNEFHNVCAGNNTNDIGLKMSSDNFGDHRTSNTGDVMCKQDTIDNIVGDRASKIRAIKIDTQGWEPNIILGAINTLRAVADDCLMIIEYWPYGLYQNGFTPKSYDVLFDIFKGHATYHPHSLEYHDVKDDPYKHCDIVLYKTDRE